MIYPYAGNAAFRLGDTVRRSLSGLQDAPLARSRFELDKARTEHGLNRQKQMDELALPGMKVQQQVNQNYLQEAESPVYMGMLWHTKDPLTGKSRGDINAFGHWMWQKGDGKEVGGGTAATAEGPSGGAGAPGVSKMQEPPMIKKFADMWGADWDLDPKSPTHMQLVKKDGTPVKLQDIHRNAPRINAFISANTSLDKLIEDSRDRTQRDFMAGRLNKDQYGKMMTRINQAETDPSFRMKLAEEKINFLSQFGNKGNPLFNSDITRGIERWKKVYDDSATILAKQREKASDREFEMKKLETQEAGKDRRHKENIGQKEADRLVKIEEMFSKEKIEKAKAEKKEKERTWADRLNQMKYEAQSAYLEGNATEEQIRVFGMDKDVYLAQAAKLVNDEQTAAFDDEKLTPEAATDRIIDLANRMREAAAPGSNVKSWRDYQ